MRRKKSESSVAEPAVLGQLRDVLVADGRGVGAIAEAIGVPRTALYPFVRHEQAMTLAQADRLARELGYAIKLVPLRRDTAPVDLLSVEQRRITIDAMRAAIRALGGST